MLLEQFLKPLNMTQSELAKKLEVSYPRVNELLHVKRRPTPDTALRLGRLLGNLNVLTVSIHILSQFLHTGFMII